MHIDKAIFRRFEGVWEVPQGNFPESHLFPTGSTFVVERTSMRLIFCKKIP